MVGAIAILLLALTMLGSGSGLNRGDALFYAIYQFGVIALVVLAPLLTADVISRERREGTLDLLFLTPLTATKLVFAKFATQLFRLLSIWAVLIPLSVVPFLSGGLAPVDVLRMLLLELTAILIALSAGMLASVFSKRALPATLLALTFTSLFLWIDWELLDIQRINSPGSNRWSTEVILTTNLVIVLLGSIFALLRIARLLIKQRDVEENSPRRIWFRQTFLAPRFWRQKFNRTMRQRMNRNPLIWLEYRTAWSRVGRTAMIGGVILVESLLLASEWAIQELPSVHVLMGFVILVVLAITSASSFQREKESGAFELLLVAPFTEFSLIYGRLRAVWSYYTPVVLTLFVLVVFAFSVGIDWGISSYYLEYDSSGSEGARFWSGAASFVTIPIAGLFFALRLKHLITTLIATIAFGFVLPMYFWTIVEAVLLYCSRWFFESGFVGMLVHPFENGIFPWISASLALHVGLCAYFLAKTHQRLKSRNFN
ncbi:MAG TPA: ABC transporter permease subunit [Verrucomicrobiae bacterium]